MKKILLPLILVSLLILPSIATADGMSETKGTTTGETTTSETTTGETAPGGGPVHHHHRRNHGKKVAEEPIPPPPACIPSSEHPKVNIIAWDSARKVSTILGAIQECVTTQWDILKLFSGPNTIGLHYPDEKEMWGYRWMWSYKLKNPIEDTIIYMDHPGKRLMKGKNPVNLLITFNKDDVVERVELNLIKKKNNQYLLFN
jgi:hypothetical protein